MRKGIFILKTSMLLTVATIQNAHSWGKIGHPTVGRIAEHYLTPATQKKVEEILAGQNLGDVANFADAIKGNRNYSYLSPWHYVSIDDGLTYATSNKSPLGDLYGGTKKFIADLKSNTTDPEQKQFALKMLVHLMGDFHQPLHVGRTDDRGGNDIKIKWNGKSTNLHSIWDSALVETRNQTSMEIAEELIEKFDENETNFSDQNLDTWIKESMDVRDFVYSYSNYSSILEQENSNPELESVAEKGYAQKAKPVIEKQLFRAGHRLAVLLNTFLK